LLGYHWPGNLAELRSTLQIAALKARGTIIPDRALHSLLKLHARTLSDRKAFSSEQDWILYWLKRNRLVA
jgi:transcriptional regulator of acetoin/glycerol metabolism